MQSRQVIVVGGGITGLAAAYRLTRLAPEQEVTLIEQERRLGGKIVTERVDGFVIEGGPDSFLSAKPRGVGLCHDLGLADCLHGPNETTRGAFVMRRGKLHRLPEGLTGLIPSRLGPMVRTDLISPLGKARMGLDFLLPRRPPNGDEPLAAFIERRLGREAYERLIEPLMAGIYAGDGRRLSLAATFPQLRQGELDHGGLIKGVLAARKRVAGPTAGAGPRPGFLTLPTGLAELVETITAQLQAAGVRILTGTTATDLRAASNGPAYELTVDQGTPLQADTVTLATPAFVTADLLAQLDPDASESLRAIPHVSTATVAMAYPLRDIPRPLDGYGYVVPRIEQRPVLACTWVSAKWVNRAPEGYGLIRAFIGRAGQGDALARSDEELLALARAEARDVLGVTAAPSLSRVFRWPRGMPQYTLGHLDRVAAIERRLAAHPGLFVAGNAYRGVGIPDCVASGEAAAERALSLTGSHPVAVGG